MNGENAKVLEQTLRPLIEADGGTVDVLCTEGRVDVYLGANCCGCPGFEFTRINIIEPMVHRYMSGKIMLVVHYTEPHHFDERRGCLT